MVKKSIMLSSIESVKKFVAITNKYDFPITLTTDKYKICLLYTSCSAKGYLDYICPQLYVNFENPVPVSYTHLLAASAKRKSQITNREMRYGFEGTGNCLCTDFRPEKGLSLIHILEGLIFNGTPNRKAQGFAEVTLTIDNSDRKLAFDSDEVAVTRRYYRSGESEYRLNHASVRLRDVTELFLDTGLGRDGYSMIGQGKIDAIVAARSDDRREIFEEAAGIARFRFRKEDAESRLARAEDNLLRLHDILAELESRLGPLKEQSEKAQQFLQLSEEKRTLEIGLWLDTLERSGRILREQDVYKRQPRLPAHGLCGSLRRPGRRGVGRGPERMFRIGHKAHP